MDHPKDQPHAIAHVLQPTLWGENQKREPVSITGDAMVPHARGPSPGAPKGNKVFGSTRSTMALHVRCWPFCDVLIPPNGRFALPAQPVAATQALNLSAGVSNCKVSRGRSFIRRMQGSRGSPLCDPLSLAGQRPFGSSSFAMPTFLVRVHRMKAARNSTTKVRSSIHRLAA